MGTIVVGGRVTGPARRTEAAVYATELRHTCGDDIRPGG